MRRVTRNRVYLHARCSPASALLRCTLHDLASHVRITASGHRAGAGASGAALRMCVCASRARVHARVSFHVRVRVRARASFLPLAGNPARITPAGIIRSRNDGHGRSFNLFAPSNASPILSCFCCSLLLLSFHFGWAKGFSHTGK